MLRAISVLAFLCMISGILGLIVCECLFSPFPWVIFLQGAAFLLMVWARVTFGIRSFHLSADPTEGQLIRTGPYRFIRHPIYAAVILFTWAGVLPHLSLIQAPALASLVLIGAFGRIFCEEKFLFKHFPDYKDYAAKTKRIIPFVL